MPHHVDIHVGRRLKTLRLMRRITQKDMALSLNISFQQLQKYETGANRMSASRMYEISKILKVKPSTFFEGLSAETFEKEAPEVHTKIQTTLDEMKRSIKLIDELINLRRQR